MDQGRDWVMSRFPRQLLLIMSKLAKSLGVTSDNKLDWSSHIDKLTKEIASGIGAIKRIRYFVLQATLHLIYQAIIQPHFDYCNAVWGNCGINLQYRNYKIAQPVLWLILTMTPMVVTCLSSSRELLGWRNLSCQQQIQRVTMVFKSLHGLAPDWEQAKCSIVTH